MLGVSADFLSLPQSSKGMKKGVYRSYDRLGGILSAPSNSSGVEEMPFTRKAEECPWVLPRRIHRSNQYHTFDWSNTSGLIGSTNPEPPQTCSAPLFLRSVREREQIGLYGDREADCLQASGQPHIAPDRPFPRRR